MPIKPAAVGSFVAGIRNECCAPQDMAVADKERVAAEMAALGPAVIAEIKKASADARAAKKEKKADKVCCT